MMWGLYIVIKVNGCELMGWNVHENASECNCSRSLLLVILILLL